MLCLVFALHVTLASPQPIAEIDAGKMKGEIARLAWSPDGSDFYIQTIERDRAGAITGVKHYLVSTATKNVKGVDQEPPWAAKYWAWKSAQTAPGAAAFRIDVNQREEMLRATASPTGGALAKGGTADPTQGTTFDEVANAANQTQKVLVSALTVKDETIGTWVNEPVMPGFTFGWAPAPLQLLAFARRDRKDGGPIVVIDHAGQKQELSGPKGAILPAWSDDGKRLAWLERRDKKKFQLMIAGISAQ
jgi:WD40 repeat protein